MRVVFKAYHITQVVTIGALAYDTPWRLLRARGWCDHLSIHDTYLGAAIDAVRSGGLAITRREIRITWNRPRDFESLLQLRLMTPIWVVFTMNRCWSQYEVSSEESQVLSHVISARSGLRYASQQPPVSSFFQYSTMFLVLGQSPE